MTRLILAIMTLAVPPFLFGLRIGLYVSATLALIALVRAVVLVVARRIEQERRLRWIDEKIKQAEHKPERPS